MRKKFLIPLLAAVSLPTAVNATNYLECEAIYKVAGRSAQLLMNLPSSANELIDKEQKIYDRAMKDAKKRGCYYIQ
tara:strand:- start:396 stop:623 length:228 start_codon:yes stop_codon:yes gene_type:complete